MGHVFSCTCQAKDSALVAVVVDAVTALTLIATSEVGVTSVVSTAGGDKMQTADGSRPRGAQLTPGFFTPAAGGSRTDNN